MENMNILLNATDSAFDFPDQRGVPYDFCAASSCSKALGVQRRRAQEPLEFLASGGRQELALFLGFHALGNDPQLECLGQVDDGDDDRRVAVVARQVRR